MSKLYYNTICGELKTSLIFLVLIKKYIPLDSEGLLDLMINHQQTNFSLVTSLFLLHFHHHLNTYLRFKKLKVFINIGSHDNSITLHSFKKTFHYLNNLEKKDKSPPPFQNHTLEDSKLRNIRIWIISSQIVYYSILEDWIKSTVENHKRSIIHRLLYLTLSLHLPSLSTHATFPVFDL
jgi:hypothetical protein